MAYKAAKLVIDREKSLSKAAKAEKFSKYPTGTRLF